VITNTRRSLGERIWHHWVRWFWSALALLVVLFAVGWLLARPPEPGAFYRDDAPPGAEPGELLRAEAFTRDVPAGARGWRMLYTTTGLDGRIRLASGIVVPCAQATTGRAPAARR